MGFRFLESVRTWKIFSRRTEVSLKVTKARRIALGL